VLYSRCITQIFKIAKVAIVSEGDKNESQAWTKTL
jgi:hypothetical protein